MSFIEGIDRKQHTLFPAVVDDYIAEENPVRFIDAYVNSLDLTQQLARPGFGPAAALP